jgi:uracil-DNA glycosylase family 4
MSCKLCPLSGSIQIAGHGSADAKIIVVGEHPRTEDKNLNRPFAVDPSARAEQPAQILHSVLKAFGLGVDDYYLAYALRCSPYRGKETITVKQAFRRTCFVRNLEPEIAACKAPIILLMGEHAVKSVLPETPEYDQNWAHLRCRWHEVTVGGIKRWVRVTLPVGMVQRMSSYELATDSRGRLCRGARLKPVLSAPWMFEQDMIAVRTKLKELAAKENM